MANKEHVSRLKGDIDSWNAWRRDVNAGSERYEGDWSRVNLARANLTGANLRHAILVNANLRHANLRGADLYHADLQEADLTGANISHANLSNARLSGARLTKANISDSACSGAVLDVADLTEANITNSLLILTVMRGTVLRQTNFNEAKLAHAVFAGVDLTHVIGLETCEHLAQSFVDNETLAKTAALPLSFLRGIGFSDGYIEYIYRQLPALLVDPMHRHSCFISYSSRDQDFAVRLHADLQNKGVRCWFAPHDMPIGGKILDEIDAAIRLREKLLLILSEYSIRSDWVEDEVTKAFEEERKRGQTVLFPIRLDDAVMETDEAWAAKLRARHIGDFRRWKDHDAYIKAFDRVLRDLTMKKDTNKA